MLLGNQPMIQLLTRRRVTIWRRIQSVSLRGSGLSRETQCFADESEPGWYALSTCYPIVLFLTTTLGPHSPVSEGCIGHINATKATKATNTTNTTNEVGASTSSSLIEDPLPLPLGLY